MLAKAELSAVMQILDTLNYYQLLKISPTASKKEIRDAFHREALLFHPDQYHSSKDAEALEFSKKIYSQVVDAYRTLTHHEKREAYDQAHHIFQSDKPSETGGRENVVTTVRPRSPTANAGSRFFKMAQSAYSHGELDAAKKNLQIALNADPHNPECLQLLARIEKESKKMI